MNLAATLMPHGQIVRVAEKIAEAASDRVRLLENGQTWEYRKLYLAVVSAPENLARLDEIKANIPSHVTVDLTAPAEITPAEIRERMSGNICRCGAYSNIVEAITEVAGRKA